MRTHVARALLLVGLIGGSSFGQAPPSVLYRDLDRLYYEVLGAHLGDGRLCRGRSAAVEQKQQELADALSNATAATGDKVLLFAVAANSLADVVRLNEAGAARTGDNGSLLHAAALLADPSMLEYLVSIGFGIEEWGGAGGPALFVAVSENRRDNVEWLIEHGADVNAIGPGGAVALRHSLPCRSQELVDYLLEAGATPDPKSIDIADRFGIVLRER
jgi:ankyrin repeat protein